MPEVTVNDFPVSCRRQGSGEPLLALEAEDAAGQWMAFHDALARKLDVIAPEHPGFGEAERPEWLDSVLDLAYCQLELLDQLGLSRVHLLGESLGGWVAAEMAAIAPERFSSLTLVAPMGLLVSNLPDLFIMNRDKWREVTRFKPPAPDAEPPSVEQLIKESRVQATLARVAWNPYLHDPRLPHWLHRAAMPSLVIWGRQDRLIPPRAAAEWTEVLPKAHVELIDQVGHFPGREQPQQTADAVLNFIRSHMT